MINQYYIILLTMNVLLKIVSLTLCFISISSHDPQIALENHVYSWSKQQGAMLEVRL